MNLEKILQHDVSDNIINYFTLEMVMVINMVSKQSPDLTKHHKIKCVFENEFLQNRYFFNKFSNNNKLVACIYQNNIIFWKKNDISTQINYYSDHEYNIEKIFLAIINNDFSYIFFNLFVKEEIWFDTTTRPIVRALFYKYNLGDTYDNFIKQFCITLSEINNLRRGTAKKKCDTSRDKLKYPLLTISLMADNYDMIKYILEMYGMYENYNTNYLGCTSTIRDLSQFDDPEYLYDYIRARYPELQILFDIIKNNENNRKERNGLL